MAQQHLRNVLVYLNMPTMGQPEAFIHAGTGFFDAEGNVASEDSAKLLKNWMNQYVAWIKGSAVNPC